MKQFILPYNEFLNNLKLLEELTPEESEKYNSIEVKKDIRELHNKIFGNRERFYIPFDFSYFNQSDKSAIQLEIEKLLTSNGYEIVSYSQNQCKKKDDTRIFKIGKVLNDKKLLNNQTLAVSYGQDVEKSRSVKDTSEMYVCISRNKVDIAGMSTDRSWTSCQNIRTGSAKKYVAHDIKEGSIIAYLIKKDDTDIKDPEARILIKPFINSKDSEDIVLLPCSVSYYRGKGLGGGSEKYPKFNQFLMTWANSIQPDIDGTYIMNNEVYQDGKTAFNFEDGKEGLPSFNQYINGSFMGYGDEYENIIERTIDLMGGWERILDEDYNIVQDNYENLANIGDISYIFNNYIINDHNSYIDRYTTEIYEFVDGYWTEMTGEDDGFQTLLQKWCNKKYSKHDFTWYFTNFEKGVDLPRKNDYLDENDYIWIKDIIVSFMCVFVLEDIYRELYEAE